MAQDLGEVVGRCDKVEREELCDVFAVPLVADLISKCEQSLGDVARGGTV